jgi:hypothetical protein
MPVVDKEALLLIVQKYFEKKRLPWLHVNLDTAFLAAAVGCSIKTNISFLILLLLLNNVYNNSNNYIL